jgi:hypothetical protein
MSIQANVNQMLSLGALLASHNPALKAKAEARAKEAELAKQAEGYEKELQIAKQHRQGKSEIGISARKNLLKTRQKQFSMNPSEETYALTKEAERGLAKAQDMRRTGRTFIDVLKAEETGYGIPVGALGPDAIKQIQESYTKEERKQFMAERSNK